MIHIYKHVGKLKTLLVVFALLGVLLVAPQPAIAANPTGCDHSFSRVVVEENDSSLYPTGPGDEVDQMPGGTVLLAISQNCGGGGVGSARFIYVGESGGDSYFVEFTGAVRVREEIIIPNLDNPRNAVWNSRQNGGEAVPVGAISNADSVDDILADAEDSTADDEAEADNRVSCEGGGFSLAWVMCPIIEGVASTVDFAANSLVGPFLEVEPLQTEGADGQADPVYSVWAGFRNVANVVLVVVFLIIIFAQALSLGIDAYSVKKALPRLVLAAIAIQLSYFVSTVLVDIFNVIGIGIGDFILDAATSSTSLTGGENGAVEIDVSGDFSQVFAGSSLGALFATGGIIWVAASGAFAAVATIALFVLLPVALAVLTTFFVLIIRQGIIILLIVLAPIAMTMMVLPNTEQWFKRWLDLFGKTLMMFPMIMGLFASSKLFASVLTARLPSSIPDSGPDSTLYVLTILGALIALAAPLFLVPATFKFAGGAMAAIGGFAASVRSRGTAGIQGDGRDPRSLRGGLKGMRRRGIDDSLEGSRLRFQDGETGTTRKSWRRGSSKRVPTLRSRANEITNRAIARTTDVEGRRAESVGLARKRVQELAETGKEDLLFMVAAQRDSDILRGLGKEDLAKDNDKTRQLRASAKRVETDPNMRRAASEYIATKTKNQGEQGALRKSIATMPGLSSQQRTETWGGAAYNIKQTNLAAKNTSLQTGEINGNKLVEQASRLSPYHLSMQDERFWDSMASIDRSTLSDQGGEHMRMIEDHVVQQKIRPVNVGLDDAAGIDPDDDEAAQRLVGRSSGSPRAQAAMDRFFQTIPSAPAAPQRSSSSGGASPGGIN